MSSQMPNRQTQNMQISSQSYKIITQYGDMLVIKQTVQSAHHYSHQQTNFGSANTNEQQQQQQQQQQATRPIIMTFHDLGLNSELQFATFCECEEVKLMLQTFTLIHVNFIGQEFVQTSNLTMASSEANNGQINSGLQRVCCESLPDDFKYPTIEQMAECIVDICAQLRVRSFIALAVGAGAHIVSSLALLRPDLVHGLFLINPVISSCSITEWLYFKMSAIAGNHHPAITAGNGSLSQSDSGSAHSSGEHPPSGLRKFWTNLHHHHHHHHHHHSSSHHASSKTKGQSSQQQQQQQKNDNEPNEQRTLGSIASIESQQRLQQQAPAKQTSGARLRQLILSRNFLTSSHHHHHQNTSASTASASNESTKAFHHSSITSRSVDRDSQAELDSAKTHHHHNQHKRKAPIEYLMYHHFGSAASQRFRRPSHTSSGVIDQNQLAASSSGSTSGIQRRNSSASTRSSSRRSSYGSSSVAFNSLTSEPCNLSSSPGSNSGDATSKQQQQPDSEKSLKKKHSLRRLMGRDKKGPQSESDGHSLRSNSSRRRVVRSRSVCLSASYLASFSSERQRVAYMQSVYKHYFQQLNAHNLWLFAHSFVKRRTLNLRKDCGAAAHAAAAAAALGTSICAAFVGVGLAGPEEIHQASAGGNCQQQLCSTFTSMSSKQSEKKTSLDEQVAPTLTDKRDASACSGSTKHHHHHNQQQQQQQQQALVAGTKVKRTFTCQTLIMCSSVQMHCERATKLMSLLNPLQATWIKTDQMLVLEEKPEKVCQALRLFLQGIGYSMSTYERRLRLSSAHASVSSSADSTGSARSLNLAGQQSSQQTGDSRQNNEVSSASSQEANK